MPNPPVLGITGRVAKLTADEIHQGLQTTPAWTLDGEAIRRTYQFADFPAAIRFVNRVAELAETAGHHPDIDIRWNRVTLSLSTHDEGGLTSRDFDLARRCDTVAA